MCQKFEMSFDIVIIRAVLRQKGDLGLFKKNGGHIKTFIDI